MRHLKYRITCTSTDTNNKKVVQFKTQIEEIPTLEIKSRHTRNRAAVLPPLNEKSDEKRTNEEEKSPKKSTNHGHQSSPRKLIG